MGKTGDLFAIVLVFITFEFVPALAIIGLFILNQFFPEIYDFIMGWLNVAIYLIPFFMAVGLVMVALFYRSYRIRYKFIPKPLTARQLEDNVLTFLYHNRKRRFSVRMLQDHLVFNARKVEHFNKFLKRMAREKKLFHLFDGEEDTYYVE